MAREGKHGLLIGLRRLSAGLLVVPLTAVAGGCVIQDPTPPQPAGPVVYEPAPSPEPYQPSPYQPVEQEVVRYEPAPEPVVAEYERDLSPYGHWVRTEYGRCWLPDRQPAGWQPYTVGTA